MEFYRNEREQEYAAKLSEAIRLFPSRTAELDASGEFPFENINELKTFGYTKWTLPKAYGGEGKGLYEYVLMQELIAGYSGATALAIGWHNGIVLQLQDKRRNWDEDVLSEVFEKVAKGALLNRAASEAKTGSPTRGGIPGTEAVKKNGKWIINGRKTFTTLAPVLDLFLVSAWIPEQKQMGTFLIERDTPGLSVEKTWDVISMQATGSEDLLLQNVEVEEKYLVEIMDKDRVFDEGWLLHIPACYIGIARAARNYALEYASSYSPNSIQGTISDLPNVKATLGQIELELLKCRHFLYSVASRWEQEPDQHEILRPQLGAVKHALTNSAITIVDKAMRVVGAKSLQRGNPLQQYYRDVRSGLHNPPMDDAAITSLAQHALKEYK